MIDIIGPADYDMNTLSLCETRKESKTNPNNTITDPMDSAILWLSIISLQNHQFTTSGRGRRPGITFTYTVSVPGSAGGRHYKGESVDGYGNEMWIKTATGEKKKSISRSTVELGYKRAQELNGIVKGPKALNLPGAGSYLFPVFIRLGVIKTDTDVNAE